jgi:hypothetical protein
MARTRSQSREPSVEPQLKTRQIRMADGGTASSARQAQRRKSDRVNHSSSKRLPIPSVLVSHHTD